MKNKILLILSLLSTISVISWIISDFFGGMIIYLLMYYWFIIPIVIIYAITGIITLFKIIRKGINSNKLLFYIHSIGLLTIFIFIIYNSELLKSRKLLDATMFDDLSNINIVLRENDKFETTTNGMFGYVNRISGKYILKNDTIIFLDKPYSNDFIPDTIIIDKLDSALYFTKNKNGEFNREKSFVNYFEIHKNNIVIK